MRISASPRQSSYESRTAVYRPKLLWPLRGGSRRGKRCNVGDVWLLWNRRNGIAVCYELASRSDHRSARQDRSSHRCVFSLAQVVSTASCAPIMPSPGTVHGFIRPSAVFQVCQLSRQGCCPSPASHVYNHDRASPTAHALASLQLLQFTQRAFRSSNSHVYRPYFQDSHRRGTSIHPDWPCRAREITGQAFCHSQLTDSRHLAALAKPSPKLSSGLVNTASPRSRVPTAPALSPLAFRLPRSTILPPSLWSLRFAANSSSSSPFLFELHPIYTLASSMQPRKPVSPTSCPMLMDQTTATPI